MKQKEKALAEAEPSGPAAAAMPRHSGSQARVGHYQDKTGGMPTMSWGLGLMFLGGVAGQLVGVALMPLTKGLTAPLPTIGCATAFLFGLGLLTRVISSGAPLSLIVPLNAAAVPLGSLAISIFFLGETASAARIAVLLIACVLIGISNLL